MADLVPAPPAPYTLMATVARRGRRPEAIASNNALGARGEAPKLTLRSVPVAPAA